MTYMFILKCALKLVLKNILASFVLGFWTQRGLRGGGQNGEDCKLCKGDERRGEQLHFIETFRESETKIIGYE